MKRNVFLVLGLLTLTVTAVFAQPKAAKILDKNVPIGESAILYIPNECTVFQCDDTVFGKIVPLTIGNLKGGGGDTTGKIAKPILQIPAGERVITAAMSSTKYNDSRKITYTFLPGHYYQMVVLASGDPAKVLKDMMLASLSGDSAEWCFFDITEIINAKKKNFENEWKAAVSAGTLGEGHVIEKVNAWTEAAKN